MVDLDETSGNVVDFRSAPPTTGPKYNFLLEPIDKYGSLVWKIRAVCNQGMGNCPLHNYFLKVSPEHGVLKVTPSSTQASAFYFSLGDAGSVGGRSVLGAVHDLYTEQEKKQDCAQKVALDVNWSLPTPELSKLADTAAVQEALNSKFRMVIGLGIGVLAVLGVMVFVFGRHESAMQDVSKWLAQNDPEEAKLLEQEEASPVKSEGP